MVLRKVLKGERLSFEEALELFSGIFDGKLSEVQTAAVLSVMAVRGESPEELAAAVECAQKRKVRVEVDLPRLVDTCGTGGDGRGTFNVSTASALVVRSLGIPVAKHGNRAVTGSVGSADVVQMLGLPVAEDADSARAMLEERGFAFLFAPKFHPAFARVAPVRRQLPVPTVFNLVGPLINPCPLTAQLVGVYSPEKAEVVARALALLGRSNVVVVCGEDGIDEVDTRGATLIFEVEDGRVKGWRFEAKKIVGREFEIPRVSSPDEAKETLMGAVSGEFEEASVAAAINAAFVLYAQGICVVLEGFGRAMEAIKEGAVVKTLEELRDGVSG